MNASLENDSINLYVPIRHNPQYKIVSRSKLSEQKKQKSYKQKFKVFHATTPNKKIWKKQTTAHTHASTNLSNMHNPHLCTTHTFFPS
jgi:hypothetical protein